MFTLWGDVDDTVSQYGSQHISQLESGWSEQLSCSSPSIIQKLALLILGGIDSIIYIDFSEQPTVVGPKKHPGVAGPSFFWTKDKVHNAKVP